MARAADAMQVLADRLELVAQTPTTVGSGRASLAAKLHCAVHATRLMSPSWRACCEARGSFGLGWELKLGSGSGLVQAVTRGWVGGLKLGVGRVRAGWGVLGAWEGKDGVGVGGMGGGGGGWGVTRALELGGVVVGRGVGGRRGGWVEAQSLEGWWWAWVGLGVVGWGPGGWVSM